MMGVEADMLTGVKVVSLDVYQTLVNLDDGFGEVVGEVLSLIDRSRGDYSRCIPGPDELWESFARNVVQVLADHAASDDFISVRSVFAEAYKRSFAEIGLEVDAERAADALARHHGQGSLYPDSAPALGWLAARYQLFLTSDADDDFLQHVVDRLPVIPHGVVSSESVRGYKAHPEGRIWLRLVELAGCRPEEIVHVGDGRADVVGAKRAGLRAIWLNRSGAGWPTGEAEPDATVSDLTGLFALLGHIPATPG